MNIADRIQHLRKVEGLSQEELADAVGVSRQAVSKWESEQSLPDIDKVVILSDLFGVTTDYILKGIEPPGKAEAKKTDARILLAGATAFNFTGLLLAGAGWYERQTMVAVAIGVSIMALGSGGFGALLHRADPKTLPWATHTFWTVNIWLLSFIPLSFVYNILLGGVGAPYPLAVSPLYALPLFWLVYFVLCLTVVFVQIKKLRAHKRL